MLSPFSDVRLVDVFDQDGSRYGFLVLVLEGVSAVVRVPRALDRETATDEAFGEVLQDLVARLRELTEEQLIAFHREVDETADPYLLIDRVVALAHASGHAPATPEMGAERAQVSTGFSDLDAAVGGLRPGDLWLVVAEPGQGRSTLLAQWAGHVAGTAGRRTWLVSPRDDDAAVTARLVALRGKVPLNHLQQHRLSDQEEAVADQVASDLAGAGLVMRGPDAPAMPADVVRAFREGRGPEVLLVDDVESSGWSPATLRMVADAGVLVAAAARGDLAGSGRRSRSWLNAADLALVVRTSRATGLGAGPDDGVAELSLVRNRRGPVHDCRVYFDGCYARFRDLAN